MSPERSAPGIGIPARQAVTAQAGSAAIRPGSARHIRRMLPGQRGGALLLALLPALLGGSALLATELTAGRAQRQVEAATAAALVQARDALTGRALADANRPGSLPCPALDEDGAVPLFIGDRCPAYLGRYPWRALKTGPLRDGHGQLLWYALSPELRDHASAEPQNGDMALSLRLDGYGGIAALVIAPGPALAGQQRDGSRSAANYLDGSNADDDLHFTAAGEPPFNDRLLPLDGEVLFRMVGRRVLAEIRGAPDKTEGGLLAHHRNAGSLPSADGDGDGLPDAEIARGGLPWRALQLPAWLSNNAWLARVDYRRDDGHRGHLALSGEEPGNGLRIDAEPGATAP